MKLSGPKKQSEQERSRKERKRERVVGERTEKRERGSKIERMGKREIFGCHVDVRRVASLLYEKKVEKSALCNLKKEWEGKNEGEVRESERERGKRKRDTRARA